MSNQTKRKEATREKILLAVKQLFEKQGFEETTLNQMIEHSKVSRRTFYKHFETKADILIVISRDEGTEKLQNLIYKVEHNEVSPLDALKIFYTALAQWFEQKEKIAKDLIISGIKQHSELSKDPTRIAHDFTKVMIRKAQVEKTLRTDLSVEALAGQLSGGFSLCVVRWSEEPKKQKLEEYTQATLKLFFQGANYVK